MNDLFERAKKELNEEGFLDGNKITEKGKLETEMFIKTDPQLKKKIFERWWRKLEDSFYNSEPKEFAIRILKIEKIFKRLDINLKEELK